MPRQININGLRALIKHNVIKSLAKEKLSKKQYIATLKKIETFIDSASIPELKQKGIVKNIINTALGNKSNHIKKGEGKRKRDQEEEEARRKLFENVNPEKNTTANITRSIINCSRCFNRTRQNTTTPKRKIVDK